MSHFIQHTFRFVPMKGTSSPTTAWLLIATLVLAAIFGLSSLIEPSAQASSPSTAATKATEFQPTKLDLTPIRALTEPALREEDLNMTSLRPHGG